MRRGTTAFPRTVELPAATIVSVRVAGSPGKALRAVAEPCFAITTEPPVSTPLRVPLMKRSNQARLSAVTCAMSAPGKVDGGWPKLPT